jgi:site-specific DNA recombinase
MISEYERAMITERSRRGKRFKAKSGVVNVLGGAPYGYTYIKKTDGSAASYEINEEEALIVKEIFRMYTEDFCGIGAVARTLSSRKILTRTKLTRWERSVIWSMLRNPAYCGKACFGKTGRAERRRITKPLRAKGGYVVQNGCNRERPREEWIEIPVPAIITRDTFDMAQERLKTNKQHSKRNTNIETLLQSGMMVCSECGYSLYRTYTTTSAGNKIFYCRCFGSDPYRFEGVRKCSCKPLRQDYIDKTVWDELVRLIQDPGLIRSEIEKRVDATKKTNPLVSQKALLEKQRTKGTQSMDKLLDAYQEGLIPIGQLRKRMPELQKKLKSIEKELEELKVHELALDRRLQLLDVPSFTKQPGESINSLDIKDKKKILRLLVKEIIVGENSIEIKHSIPLKEEKKRNNEKSYQLCTRSDQPLAEQYPTGCSGQGTGQEKPELRPLR